MDGFIQKEESLHTSKLCLGTMTFGSQNSLSDSFEQLDYAFENGINFIDTAEMYPIPAHPGTQGDSEKCIGKWLKTRKNRENLILASKITGPSPRLKHIRDGSTNFSKRDICSAIDGSLKRLGTDYIDLYQIHWPVRTTNNFGKLNYECRHEQHIDLFLEIIQTFDDLVKSGKVINFGISNETPWGVAQYLKLSDLHNLIRPLTIQNPYSLLNRSFEVGLGEFSHRENIGLLAYSPLGFGVLSGKYLNEQMPEKSRRKLFSGHDRYSNTQGIRATYEYISLAKKYGLDPAQMALAFVRSRTFVRSVIIGATTLKQLKANINSLDIQLSEDIIQDIESIHTKYSNPCP